MADSAGAGIATCCGLCIFSAVESWCIIHAFGTDVRCCGGPRGCCGSCCDASFDEDDLDTRLKKKEKPTEPVISQPTPSDGMSPIAASSNKPNLAQPEVV